MSKDIAIKLKNEDQNKLNTHSDKQTSSDTTINMDFIEKEEADKEVNGKDETVTKLDAIVIHNRIEVGKKIDENKIYKEDNNVDVTEIIETHGLSGGPPQNPPMELPPIGTKVDENKILIEDNVTKIIQTYGLSGGPPQNPPMVLTPMTHTYPPQTNIPHPNPYQQRKLTMDDDDQRPPNERATGPLLRYDPSERNDFIVKVLVIVLIMIIVTATNLAFMLSSEDVKEFYQTSGLWLLLIAFFGICICNYAMTCWPCGRRAPVAILVLIITIGCFTIIGAKIASHYRNEVVLYATIATGAVVFVCLVLACTKFDFTSWWLWLVVLGVAVFTIIMILVIIMLVIGHHIKPVVIVVLIVSALLQSIMFVMQLQMILGGKTLELREDDYFFAAYMMYTSILTIFVHLVHIVGLMDG